MPACECYQRGVSETKLEIPMAPSDVAREAQLFASQALDQESTLREIIQEGKLDIDAQAGQDQVVSLRHSNLRGHQRTSLFLQDLDHGHVGRVCAVCLSVQPSGVDDQRQRSLATPERLLAHVVRAPPGTGLTSSLTLAHAVKLAA